jgi:hypothetical protein
VNWHRFVLLAGVVLLSLLAWMIAKPVRAADYLTTTVASYHFDRTSSYNENQLPSLGFERDYGGDWHGMVGFYNNSYYRTSVYALAAYTPWRVSGWHTGALFGAVTGYSHPVGGMVGAVAAHEWKDFGVNVAANPVAVGIQLKWKIR